MAIQPRVIELNYITNVVTSVYYIFISINLLIQYESLYINKATPAAAATPTKPAAPTWAAPALDVEVELVPFVWLDTLAAETAEAIVKAKAIWENCILLVL